MIVYIVHAKGHDWENVEAFLKAEDAQDYLSAELAFPGVQGQIKQANYDLLWPATKPGIGHETA